MLGRFGFILLLTVILGIGPVFPGQIYHVSQ